MPSNKPIRVIDISRKLNLATATIIDFLEQKSYPVDRSHHTPLTTDVMDEINTEFGVGRHIAVLTQMTETAKKWESENREIADKIKSKWRINAERMRIKRERSRKVIEGRERSKLMRQIRHNREEAYNSAMKSVIPQKDNFDGRISVSPLQMEIIKKALALDSDRKKSLIKLLENISSLT